jgi:hypothetical protein
MDDSGIRSRRQSEERKVIQRLVVAGRFAKGLLQCGIEQREGLNLRVVPTARGANPAAPCC